LDGRQRENDPTSRELERFCNLARLTLEDVEDLPMRSLSRGLRGALLAVALLAGHAHGSGGFLGVQVNDAASGVQILSVRDGSAAATAGLVAGDLVQAIGERSIVTADDLSDALAKFSPGDAVTMKVKRAGADQMVEVKLGSRPTEAADSATPSAPVAAAAPKSMPAMPLIPAPATIEPPAPPTPPSPPAVALSPSALAPAAPAPLPAQDPAQEPPRKGGFLGVTLDGSGGADNTIGSVVDDSPAAKAKLQAGDLIVAVDGKEVGTADAISAILATKQAGDSVEITVMRDGKRKLRTAKLAAYGSIAFPAGAMVAAPLAPPSTPDTTESKTESVRAKRKATAEATETPKKPAGRGWLGVYLDPTDGITVESLADGSPAEGAGLKAGDRIVKVAGKEIGSTEDLLAALEGKAGDDVAIVVMRNGAEKRLGVTLGTPPAAMAETMPPAAPAQDEPAVAKAKNKAKAEMAEVQEKAKAQAEKAEKQIAKAEQRAKEAAAKAEEHAKESTETAMKKAKESKAKAQADAKSAEKKAKAKAKAKAQDSVVVHPTIETARWFFPAGTEMSLRIEEKDGGFWITAGSGKQGIEVPADHITNVSLEAKGGGVEVRVHGGSPHVTMGHSNIEGAGDAHSMTTFGTTTDEGGTFVYSVPRIEGKAGKAVKSEDGGHWTILAPSGDADAKEFTFKTFESNDGDDANTMIRLRKSDDASDHGIVVHRKNSDGKASVEVKKGDVHVVPHPPGGGGIVIHNNGGTVIIGDAAAHAFLGHDVRKHVDVIVDSHGKHEDKIKVLEGLGYVGGNKKADKKADKKSDDDKPKTKKKGTD